MGVGDIVESKIIVDIKPNSVIIRGYEGEVELKMNK